MHNIIFSEYINLESGNNTSLPRFLEKGGVCMAIAVTVATNETLSTVEENSFLDITFTNTEAFSYAANSNVYYYALLTDSTSGTPLTQEVTFVINYTAAGDVPADTEQTFSFENTLNLVPTITGSDGRILYTAQ